MAQLTGKTALVTGGTSGIGLAAATRLAEEGAHVYVTGRSQEGVDKAAAAIGPNATGVRSDITSAADLSHLFDEIQRNGAGLDIIFANAGGGEFAPLGAITEEHYQRTFDTNVKGVLFTVQKALPLLRDGASIVPVSYTHLTLPTIYSV